MARIEKTVFISYRRTDRWQALAVFKDLTQHGYDVFIDYDGIASGDFERAIVDNIRARAHFIVVLTPRALDRCGDPTDWLRREIEVALEAKRNIVPLLLDGFRFDDPIAVQRLQGSLEPLRRYQALNVPEDFFDPAMERLRSKRLAVAVEAVLHPPSAHAQQVAHEQRDAATIATGHIPADEKIVAPSGMAASQQRARGQRNAVAADEGRADSPPQPAAVSPRTNASSPSQFPATRGKRTAALIGFVLGTVVGSASMLTTNDAQKYPGMILFGLITGAAGALAGAALLRERPPAIAFVASVAAIGWIIGYWMSSSVDGISVASVISAPIATGMAVLLLRIVRRRQRKSAAQSDIDA